MNKTAPAEHRKNRLLCVRVCESVFMSVWMCVHILVSQFGPTGVSVETDAAEVSDDMVDSTTANQHKTQHWSDLKQGFHLMTAVKQKTHFHCHQLESKDRLLSTT